MSTKTVQEWNALKDDVERWKYLAKGGHGLMVVLDNDQSFIGFESEFSGDQDPLFSHDLDSFDEWIGNSKGVFLMLKGLGIRAEHC